MFYRMCYYIVYYSIVSGIFLLRESISAVAKPASGVGFGAASPPREVFLVCFGGVAAKNKQ
jgi:hypothetical protein